MKAGWSLLLAFVPSLAVAGPSPSPPLDQLATPSEEMQNISHGYWDQVPSSTMMLRYYPERAARANIGGTVRLQCFVAASGLLEKCSILSETPPGHGFGYAALAMTRLFKMHPQTSDGHSVTGAKVVIPLTFAPPDSSRSAAPSTLSTPSTDMPHWVLKPDSKDIAKIYPDMASRRNVGGHALIQCKATADGSMSDCELVSEEPLGLGFGDAALRLAPDFKLSPNTPSGRSVEGRTIRIPMTFTPAATGPYAPTSANKPAG